MLEKYRTGIRQGILFGIMLMLLAFGLKGADKVAIIVMLAGLLTWYWGWWSLARAKGQKRIGGGIISFSFTMMLLAGIFALLKLIKEYRGIIALVGFLVVLVIVFLPDKHKTTPGS